MSGTDSPDRKPVNFRILGGFLWTMVLVALFFMWWSSRNSESNGLTSKDSEGWKSPTEIPIWNPNGIEDFSLTERSGRTITKGDLLGKPWAACFIFTRCAGGCLQVSDQMQKLQASLKSNDVDATLVSISVDPTYDTPERLKKYADHFDADPDRWLFLTGDKEEIYQLIHNSFQQSALETQGKDRKPGFEVAHSFFILHVNAKGVVVKKYAGTNETEMTRLRQALQREAGSLAAESTSDKNEISEAKDFQPLDNVDNAK